MGVVVDVRQATDSEQKYSDVSSFPYIFHINLQLNCVYSEVNSCPILIFF
jgi:hypothetical protein